MNISPVAIVCIILAVAFLGSYIGIIISFAKNLKKPKEERASLPTVLFIVFTTLLANFIVLCILLLALGYAIVANM